MTLSDGAPAGRLARTLTFIRFSHTVFALPFALGAMLVAANGVPSVRVVILILLAMVFARTAAMGFNRVVDWEIDKRNPRTEGRHRLISRSGAIALTIGSAITFVGVAAAINRMCFLLSPVALAIVFFYSLTKRFTPFSHFFLGLALSVSPVGAWLAVRGQFAWPPLILAAAVLFWVAGFDVIYATQDVDFDRQSGLHSMAVRLGIDGSLRLAQILHAVMFGLLVAFGVLAGLERFFFGSLLLILAALFYEHHAARRLDVKGVNDAFFKSNAFVGLVFVAGICGDLWL